MSDRFLRKKKFGSYPYLTVVFSITLALTVIGLFALIFFHVSSLSRNEKENFQLHVYLSHSLPENKISTLQQMIAGQNYVLKKEGKAQIKYISEKEAAEIYIKETGDDFTKILEDNPLHGSFVIGIDPMHADTTYLGSVVKQLRTLDGVFEVDYQPNVITKINTNLRNITIILLISAFVLITASVLLINNTIKLALFSQRFLIRSMQLVGATRWFIKRPFLLHAILQGVISGIIAAGSLALLLHYAYKEIPELNGLNGKDEIIYILASLLVVGILISLISSYRAVSKYLKMSLDELY